MFGASKPPAFGFTPPAAAADNTTKTSGSEEAATASSNPFAAFSGAMKPASTTAAAAAAARAAALPSGGFAFTKTSTNQMTPPAGSEAALQGFQLGGSTTAAASSSSPPSSSLAASQTAAGTGKTFSAPSTGGFAFGSAAPPPSTGASKGFGFGSASPAPASASPPASSLRTPPPAAPTSLGQTVAVQPGMLHSALAGLAGPGRIVQSVTTTTAVAPAAIRVAPQRTIPAGPLLVEDTSETDVNAALVKRHGALHRLTRAVDAVMARHYVAQQKQAMLDDLEAVVERLEAERARTAEERTRVQARCQLLHGGTGPHPRMPRAVVGEDMELVVAYNANAEAMQKLYAKHLKRLEDMMEQLSTFPERS